MQQRAWALLYGQSSPPLGNVGRLVPPASFGWPGHQEAPLWKFQQAVGCSADDYWNDDSGDDTGGADNADRGDNDGDSDCRDEDNDDEYGWQYDDDDIAAASDDDDDD